MNSPREENNKLVLHRSSSQNNVNNKNKKTELFNATGAQLLALQAILDRKEKKRIERLTKHDKFKYARERVAELLKLKTHQNQMYRLYDSSMSTPAKMAIIGDEYNLREELKKGFPINSRDSTTGRALLHEAACCGHLHIVRMLCREFNANTRVTTVLGQTSPLHLAVRNNYRQISVILLEHNANVNQRDGQNCTPLHYVQSKTLLKLLLQKGADPCVKSKTGLKPREYYIVNVPLEQQDVNIIQKLLHCEEAVAKKKFTDEIKNLQINNASKHGSLIAIAHDVEDV